MAVLTDRVQVSVRAAATAAVREAVRSRRQQGGGGHAPRPGRARPGSTACSASAPNLFCNSPMEACVVVCRTRKPARRRGRVLFIDAVNEVARERTQSFLAEEHQRRIVRCTAGSPTSRVSPPWRRPPTCWPNDGNLSTPRYVRRPAKRVGRARGGRPGVLAADGRDGGDARRGGGGEEGR